MKSGIVSLHELNEYVRFNDPQGEGIRGISSPEGKALSKFIRKVVEEAEIDKLCGFYLWGYYDKKGLWKNPYLGKAGYGRHSGLYKRLGEELWDERPLLWQSILDHQLSQCSLP